MFTKIMQGGKMIPLKVIAIKMHQKEGMRPLCDMIAHRNPDIDLSGDICVFIDDVLQFMGNVTSVNLNYTPYCMKIELTGVCVEKPEMLLLDRCFSEDPLEGQSKLIHYPRLGGRAYLCDFVAGRHRLSLSHIFDIKCLKMPAPKRIEVTVVAEWVERIQEILDLWPQVESSVPDSQFYTLTPDQFKASWIKLSEIKNHTGYTVIDNQLVEVGHKYLPYKDGFFKATRFSGALKMLAQYEKRYFETACFTIGDANAEPKKLVLKVPLHHYQKDRFFDIEPAWAQHIYDVAYCHYLSHNRQVVYKVEGYGDADMLSKIDLDTMIEAVVNDCAIEGKIIEYAIENNGSGYQFILYVAHMIGAVIPKAFAGFVKKNEEMWHADYVEDMAVRGFMQHQLETITEEDDIKTKPTTVEIKLKDLRNLPVVKRVFGMC